MSEYLLKIIYLTTELYNSLKSGTPVGGLTKIEDNYLYVTGDSFNIEDISGILPISKGGTGLNSLPSGLLYGDGTNNITSKIVTSSIENNANKIPTALAVYNDALLKSGGTMTGQIVLASNGFKTNAADGYSVDSHGNFKHLRATTNDYFHLDNSAGTAKLSVYWESGNVTAAGTVTASGFSGSGASLTSLNGSNITTGTVAAARIDSAIARLASPAFSGTPTVPTAADGTSTTLAASTAFVMNQFKYNDAMIFKGTLAGTSSTTYTPAADCGHTYKVSAAGKINGINVEVGDLLICTTDNTSAATSSNVNTVKNNWAIILTNIDGAVIGPASSTANHIVVFDGETGKLIKGSGITISTATPASGATDTTVPTSKAVWAVIDNLDGNLNGTTPGTGKTISGFSQTNGIVSVTFSTISITKGQISDFPTSMTPASHSHGNIANDGTIATSTSSTIANGDAIVISTSANSGKLTRASITFDGSTTSSVLSKKGTWVDMYTHPTGAGNNHIPSGGSSGQFLGWNSTGTAKWVNNPNTDKNVEQGVDATTYYRGVLLTTTTYSTTSPSVSTTTGIIYSTTGIVIKPSDNSLYVAGTIYSGGNTVLTTASNVAWGKLTEVPSASTTAAGIIKIGTGATDAAAGNHNHDDTYVNVTGDTMTGELKFINPEATWPATYKMVTLKAKDNREFNFKISNSGTNVDVGYDWNAVDGPGAAFRSSSHTSEAGYFYIYARSSAGTTQLKGTPAGVLTWGDLNVMASAGASNSTSALYLIGATTQTTGPLTYSNSYLFAENGALSARSVGINYGTTANKAVVLWNDTDKSLDFIFN